MSMDEQHYQSRYDRAVDEAAVDGEVLGEGAFVENYGKGLRVDLAAFLRESERAPDILKRLDKVERFVLLSYFLLRKTEKQLAVLVGLNECRFNIFLENLVNKIGAMVAFGNLDPESWEGVLAKNGLQELKVRVQEIRVRQNVKSARAMKEAKRVRTVDVLSLFIETRSFLRVSEHFGAYYVDLRRGLEDVAEGLKARKDLPSISLGQFVGAMVQFADVKDEGYAGRMGKLPELISVLDPAVLGRSVVRIDKKEYVDVLTPRALGSVQGGN